jgi:hypothetical protein
MNWLVGDKVVGKYGDRTNVPGEVIDKKENRGRIKLHVEWKDQDDGWISPDSVYKKTEESLTRNADIGSEESSDNDNDTDDNEQTDESEDDTINENMNENMDDIGDFNPLLPIDVGPNFGPDEIPNVQQNVAHIDPIRGGLDLLNGRGRGRGRRGGRAPNIRRVGQAPAGNPELRPNDLPAEAENLPRNLLNCRLTTRPPTYLQWFLSEDVNIENNNILLYRGHTSFNWGHVADIFDNNHIKTPFQYFMLMHPVQYVARIMEYTVNCMVAQGKGRIATWEYYAFLGITLARSLEPTPGNLEHYWNVPIDDNNDSTLRPPDFSTRFGMSHTTYRKILSCLRLDDYLREGAEGQDRYLPIREYIHQRNIRRENVITPGREIIIDECMSAYKGVEMLFKDLNTIHITKIIRKPKGVGIELKASCDGETNIILRLEIQEGALVAGTKEFETAPHNLPFHCAVVLRLANPWLRSGRVIKGDSAFTSVKTAIEVLKRGCHYQGPLKSCYSGFPKEHFEEWGRTTPERGAHTVVTANVTVNEGENEKVLLGIGWCAKKKMTKTFISTFGSSFDGDPHVVLRSARQMNEETRIWETVHQERPTNRPSVVADIFKNINSIDLHDRYRQGYLALENSWGTHVWWHRLFATLLGMDATDAYMAYSYDFDRYAIHEDGEKMSFFQFLGKLAYSLIFNPYREQPRNIRRRENAANGNDEAIQVLFLTLFFPKKIVYLFISLQKSRLDSRASMLKTS